MPGHCYEKNGEAFMDYWLGLRDTGLKALVEVFGGGIVMVHGRPTLTVPPFEKYGHAWIEVGGSIVYDAERGLAMPIAMFYRAGRIVDDECYRYDFEEFRRFVLDSGHWGPWEGPEAVGPGPTRKGE